MKIVKLIFVLTSSFIIWFGCLTAYSSYKTKIQERQSEIEYIQTLEDSVDQAQQELDSVEQSSEEYKQKLEEKIKQEAELKKQIKDLQAKKKAEKQQSIAVAPKAQAAAPVQASGDIRGRARAELNRIGQGQYWYAVDFIFSHESTWRPHVINGIGCKGLGQSCPGGSGLVSECPNWSTDIECQVRHFTKYAARYGGWAGSYAEWQRKNWW